LGYVCRAWSGSSVASWTAVARPSRGRPIPTRWACEEGPAALRWARSSAHYDATVAFYRDAVGLPIVGEFTASFGEDGTIFGLRDTSIQMEIVRAHPASDGDPDGFDQLVHYLNDAEAVITATAKRKKVLPPVPHGCPRSHPRKLPPSSCTVHPGTATAGNASARRPEKSWAAARTRSGETKVSVTTRTIGTRRANQ